MNSAAALSTAVDACCCSLATRRPLMARRARRRMCPDSTTLVRKRIASVTTATDSSDSACSHRNLLQGFRRISDVLRFYLPVGRRARHQVQELGESMLVYCRGLAICTHVA